MIDFLKNIFKNINSNSENEELNKLNKIIYALIIICALCFVGFIIYFVIKLLPDLTYSIKEAWNDSKVVLNKF